MNSTAMTAALLAGWRWGLKANALDSARRSLVTRHRWVIVQLSKRTTLFVIRNLLNDLNGVKRLNGLNVWNSL
jgi:hypothetical protein